MYFHLEIYFRHIIFGFICLRSFVYEKVVNSTRTCQKLRVIYFFNLETIKGKLAFNYSFTIIIITNASNYHRAL